MSAFEGFHRRLTQLYSDTKQSCDAVTKEEKVANVPELLALHLEFRIQRERLATWGLEWRGDNTAADESIDEAVARAGVTDTVTDVLQNIQLVLWEAERIRQAGSRTVSRTLSGEKAGVQDDAEVIRWSIQDRSRYETLAKDLKDSIDLLDDLSKTRRELREGTYPTSGKGKRDIETSIPSLPPATQTKPIFSTPTYASSEDTLVNPTRVSTFKSNSSFELPSRLDPSLLELPEEGPPGYDRIGATVSSRMIAYLKQPSLPSSTSTGQDSVVRIPVLVEFAPYDPAYRVTGVPICTDRLTQLLSFYARPTSGFDDLAKAHLSCLGFFEDAKLPRFALVYELPKSAVSSPISEHITKATEHTTLLELLQNSSKTVNGKNKNLPQGPPLEDRFRMAFNIMHAFYRMHSEERFTHKNVNSSNVIFFSSNAANSESGEDLTPKPRSKTSWDVRAPYVSSFDLFSEYSLEKLPAVPARNIYRHQDDPMISETECSGCEEKPCTCSPYRFDIHSLAMILVEIGLWMPVSDFYKTKYSLNDLKMRVEMIWMKRLRMKCGSMFANVVKDMLSGSSRNIGEDDLRSCYDNWLGKLRRCCLIDESDDDLFLSTFATQSPQNQTQSWSRTITPKASTGNLARVAAGRSAVAARVPTAILETGEDDLRSDRKASNAGSSFGLDGTTALAANVIQKAWRTRHNMTPFSLYRQKVMLIQRLWRNRRSTSSSPSSDSDTQRIDSDGIVLESKLVRASHQPALVQVKPKQSHAARPKLRIHNVKLRPESLYAWHEEYQPVLERIVDRALRHSPESASIELHMVGETAATARPTVFINCTSTARVKSAIHRKWHFDPNSLDIKVRRAKISRSKASKTAPAAPHRSMVNSRSTEQMPLNPFHQQRPMCGASIGAFVGKHLPPVSFGGVVDVDGELYGMTVHHLLDDPSDEEADDEPVGGAQRSSGRRDESQSFDDLIGGFGGAPSLQTFPSDSMFPFEISDDEDDALVSDEEDFLSDDEDTGYSSEEASPVLNKSVGTLGDVNGIIAGSRNDILVTQPALDDVDEDFFPCAEDRDEDHIDSHTLGYVYASSGIKRWNRKGVVHEIDWALLKLEDNRLQSCNLVQGGKRYHQQSSEQDSSMTARLRQPVSRGAYKAAQDEFPTSVAKSDELSNLPVHCFGRTSGLAGGVIGPAMSSVRIYKRRSFSRSWFVMGDFGVGGDSGAWVIDNDQGRVCGHVLAWCSRNKIAYICPAEVLLDDMKRTLNATRICLPGSIEEKNAIPATSTATATATATINTSRGPVERRTISAALAEDLSRLSLANAGTGLFRSRLNGSSISPRMELQRLFGSEIAQ